MLPPLKVYVWNNFDNSIDGSCGFAIAIARNLESAVAMVEEESGMAYDLRKWGKEHVIDLKEMAFTIPNLD